TPEQPVNVSPQKTAPAARWTGQPVQRKEDAALLSGRARFFDDLTPVSGMKHAAILRSPHAHARIRAIDAERALGLPGIVGVVTGADLAKLTGPIPSVVKAPVPYFPFAIDKVRYVGEPVAVVVADDRYLAEDALEAIAVDYEALPAVADLAAARTDNAPLLHEKVGSNTVNRRSFRYGDPDRAFAEAPHVLNLSFTY